MASSGSSAPGNGARRPRAAGRAIYGGLPESGPPGFAPRILELADELRREGLAVGTSELLDAFQALRELSWTDQEDFREALAATLAKSQEDRLVFEIVFDRFFFRAVEREAVERGLTEERYGGGDRPGPQDPRRRLRAALRQGAGGGRREMGRAAPCPAGRCRTWRRYIAWLRSSSAGWPPAGTSRAAAAARPSSTSAAPCAPRSRPVACRCGCAIATGARGGRSSTSSATCRRA